MTKIVVISEYVYSGQNSTGYLWSKVIDKAGQCFSGISVISPLPHEKDIEKRECANAEYLEFESKKFDKNNLAWRLLGQVRQCLGFLRYIFRYVKRGDVVLSGTNPALLLVLISITKNFLGFRWCLLVHDVFPENLVPAGVLRKSMLSYRLCSWIFNMIYARADHIVVIGRDMEDIVKGKTGSDKNITVIQNWVDDRGITPQDRSDSEILKSLGWTSRKVFQFFGNIGRVQGIDNILAAIELVRSPNAAFLFIGEGSASPTVREFVEGSAGGNVAYIGPINQDRKSVGLAACDVALITLGKGMLGLGVPSKAYFSMAADKPLLAVMEGGAEISRMIHEDRIGWTCEPDDPAALAALIDHICQTDISCLNGRPRKVLQEKYSESAALDKFLVCVKSVMDVK